MNFEIHSKWMNFPLNIWELIAIVICVIQSDWKKKDNVRFQGGAVLCKLIKFGQPFGLYLSSYILTVTAMDRYYAICHPFSYCSVTSRRSKMMVYGAWTLAAILCVPQVRWEFNSRLSVFSPRFTHPRLTRSSLTSTCFTREKGRSVYLRY